MNWKLMLTSSVRMMLRYKLRTLFMSIGVCLGVATLIAGQALGTGSQQQLAQRVDQMFGPGTILIFSSTLNAADLEEISSQLDQVIAWAPRFTAGMSDVSYQGVDTRATVFGHAQQADFVWNRGVMAGRFFNSDDISQAARVALIGTRLAEKLFTGASALDQQILIGSIPFRIVGVLEPVGIDPHGEDRDEDVFVPITTAMRRISNSQYIGSAKLVVSNHELVDQDADQVAGILRQRHRIAAGERDDFAIYTSKFAGQAAVSAKQVVNTYVFAASIVVLLVAAAVISSIMLVVVRERVSEIGLRKAIGATKQQISLQFLLETAAVTLISGLIGVGLGLLVASVVSDYLAVPMVVGLPSIMLGLIAALTVGVVSGLLPAKRAAGLEPIEVLR